MKSKTLLGLAVAIALAAPAFAQGSHAVRGYTRKDGTYVAPHMQTNPDSSRTNNWSSIGNVNPYTGKPGTIDPYAPRSSTASGSDGSKPKPFATNPY